MLSTHDPPAVTTGDFELIGTIINDGAQGFIKGSSLQTAGQNRNMTREEREAEGIGK